MLPDLETREAQLAEARRKLRRLIVIGMRPGHSREQLARIEAAERWYRADVTLRALALEYWRRVQMRPAPRSGSVMTVPEHRKMAESARELVRHRLAQGLDILVRMGEHRLAKARQAGDSTLSASNASTNIAVSNSNHSE
jgi:hypothetical protein